MKRGRLSRLAGLRITLYIIGGLLLLAVAGYFLANALVRGKVDQALRELPPRLTAGYASIHVNPFGGTMEIRDISARYTASASQAHVLTIGEIDVEGFSLINWLAYHRLRISGILAKDIRVELDEGLLKKDSAWSQWKPPVLDVLVNRIAMKEIDVEAKHHDEKSFSMQGDLELDSVTAGGPSALRLTASQAEYTLPAAHERIKLREVVADSKKKLLRIDTVEVRPTLGAEEIGRLKGHQVDVVSAEMRNTEARGIDIMELMRHRLYAGQISLGGGVVHIFRDRRLPLETGEKPMPVEGLEGLPVDLRVERVRLGKTRFEYEEYPKVGKKTGELVIEDFHGTMEPLINKPHKGDPAFITVRTAGSLMGSGSVTATTLMPFHRDSSYKVEGAFHDLDVTSLNNPAENLGQLRLESGMLNSLDFRFDMGPVRSTGKIVGVYHNLIADKLKEKNGELKINKLKSFALKKLIIPRNKDESLPVSKRTGKVNYKRDKERYFSYYLLHSLLVGVKSSFRLGFLLPG